MGRHIQPGTKMDVKQDARDTSLTTENVVLEQEQNSEGRSTNTQLQLQIAVSEPVQSSNVEDSVEPKNETAETDGAAGLEGSQILVAETNKQIATGSVTVRYLPVASAEEFRAVNEPAARRGLSLDSGSTSSRINDADTATPSAEGEGGIEARKEQLGISASSKRPAVSTPRAASPLWWDANRLADPRESKRSGELMNRNRQGGRNHAPNFSRWESVSCDTRTQDPRSSHCSLIDLRDEVNSEDSARSMQVDPVPVSPSREMSPEPTVIPLEERQEQLRLQAIEMRMRSNRTRPAPVRPVNESSPSCSQSDLLSWIRMVERRNEERERRNPPDRDFTERYSFDIHRDLPLKEGRWEWENVQQP